jgi:hypothetical protein
VRECLGKDISSIPVRKKPHTQVPLPPTHTAIAAKVLHPSFLVHEQTYILPINSLFAEWVSVT